MTEAASASTDSPDVKRGRPRRADWQEPFLENFRTHGVQAWAAHAVSVSVDTVAVERKRNPGFAGEYDASFEHSTAVLEYTSHRWGSTGLPVKQTVTKETVKIQDGRETVVERITTVTESVDRSPALAIFMLKSRRPDVYRERLQVEQTGAEGGPIRFEMTQKEIDAADREISRLVDELAPRREAKAARGA